MSQAAVESTAPAYDLSPEQRNWGDWESLTPVDLDGGIKFESESGVVLTVPAIVELADEQLEVRQYEGPEDRPFLLSPILDIEAPSLGLELASPARIEFPIPTGASTSSATIAYFDELSGIWFPVETAMHDGILSAETLHFSSWAVAATAQDGEDTIGLQLKRFLGLRARQPECEGSTPFWLEGWSKVPGPDAQILVCAGTHGSDRLLLRITNNRTVATRVEFDAVVDQVSLQMPKQVAYEELTEINDRFNRSYRARFDANAPQTWVFIPAGATVDLAFSDPGIEENQDQRVLSNQIWGTVTGNVVYDADTFGAHIFFVLTDLIPLAVRDVLDLPACLLLLGQTANGEVPDGGIFAVLSCIDSQIERLFRQGQLSRYARDLLKKAFNLTKLVKAYTIDLSSQTANWIANDSDPELVFRSKNQLGVPPVTPPPTQPPEEQAISNEDDCGTGPGYILVPGDDGEVVALELTKNRFFATAGCDAATPEATVQTAIPQASGRPLRTDVSASSMLDLGDGRLALSSGQTVRVWNYSASQHLIDPSNPPEVDLPGHDRQIQSMVQLPNGRLATSDLSGNVHLWDPRPDSIRLILADKVAPGTPLLALESGRLASVAPDGAIELWSPANPDVVDTRYAGHNSPVSALIELPNGRIASGDSRGGLHIWEVASGSTLSLGNHHDPTRTVTALALAPNEHLLSASRDGTVQSWDLSDVSAMPRTVLSFGGGPISHYVTGMILAPDGRVFAGASDGVVYAWDPTATDQEVAAYPQHEEGVRAVLALADGRLVSSGDAHTEVWKP